jgi:mono/diheme cytochrome c family protein
VIAALAASALVARAATGAPPRATSCEACHPVHHRELGTCVGCHRGDPTTRRKELAHVRLLRGEIAEWSLPASRAVEQGDRLRARAGCRRCHVTGGRGNRLATVLDRVVWKRDPAALRRSILAPVSTMPDFGFTPRQADRLVAVLLRDADRAGADARYQVRFADARADGPHPFQKRCGPCHRALTPLGPMGIGLAGPDLSGLLTPYYPSTDGRRWDRARLERWLRDPRRERPHATMPPLDVPQEELDRVCEVLAPTSAR